MIKFYKESLDNKLCEELLPLLKASADEVYSIKDNLTLYNSMNLTNIYNNDVNFKFFIEKDKQGFLNVCTMRDNNKLVGHWTTFLSYHAQSNKLLVADTQNIHILKEYRGLNSIKFMKFTEQVLRDRGVKLLSLAINPSLKQDKLLNRLGFSIDEVVYTKGL